MKTLLVEHRTMTSGTAQMVEAAVRAGCSEGSFEVLTRRAFDATAADV